MKNLIQEEKEVTHGSENTLNSVLPRRSFLQFAGAGAVGIALMAAGCSKDKDYVGPTDPIVPGENKVNLGSGDNGILNYALVLEQLEAAFYTKVVASFWSGISEKEQDFITDIQLHEVAHRELLNNLLGDKKIGNLAFDFSKINFSDRNSVLTAAKDLEDIGVAAYNGIAPALKSKDALITAAKIVSVEARHAAYIRETLKPNDFAAGVVGANGQDRALPPSAVLDFVKQYITTEINASNLPTA
jgi:hypothetical protein